MFISLISGEIAWSICVLKGSGLWDNISKKVIFDNFLQPHPLSGRMVNETNRGVLQPPPFQQFLD